MTGSDLDLKRLTCSVAKGHEESLSRYLLKDILTRAYLTGVYEGKEDDIGPIKLYLRVLV